MPNQTLDHPYHDITSAGHWLRGNLHTHSTNSDGKREPQRVLDDYAQRGYDFLMMSDHDVLTTPGDYDALNTHDMLMIPGNEISAAGPHVLHVNASAHIPPDMPRQRVINEAIRSDGNSFIVAAHPNWQQRFDHTSIDQLREWTGYAGLEIYNGTIGRLPGSPYATNKWDMLLAEGRKLWGYAHDDSHSANDVELGWNMVWVAERTVGAVVDALRRGRFYASTGVTIDTIDVEGMQVRVESSDADRIVALGGYGKRLAHADATALTVEVPAEQPYVRFELWGRGERRAWTQPFFTTG